MVLRLSWSMKRRVERWKVRYAKLYAWNTFAKNEIIKDYNKIKGFMLKFKKNKGVTKMKIDKTKKETIFFKSDEYIGLTVDKGEIKLIEKPPQALVIGNKPPKVFFTNTRVAHDRNCECDDCLESLLNSLKFKFDTENDE